MAQQDRAAAAAGLDQHGQRIEPCAFALAATLVTGYAHARLLIEYVSHQPGNPKRLIARHLEARGVKYARANYWRAYAITFLTNERIIVASEDYQRILEYTRLVDAHRDEAVRLSPDSCPGGKSVMYKLWICPPSTQ